MGSANAKAVQYATQLGFGQTAPGRTIEDIVRHTQLEYTKLSTENNNEDLTALKDLLARIVNDYSDDTWNNRLLSAGYLTGVYFIGDRGDHGPVMRKLEGLDIGKKVTFAGSLDIILEKTTFLSRVLSDTGDKGLAILCNKLGDKDPHRALASLLIDQLLTHEAWSGYLRDLLLSLAVGTACLRAVG
ncbi:MAG: hypothetical protein M1840_003255 [Geoglossum simile]|nr:MAG: hypothetical protein M1840_003255 [Geoglossum simile]